jgi:hypothetical protein
MSAAALPRPLSTQRAPSRSTRGSRDWIGPAAAAVTLAVHGLILSWLLAKPTERPASAPLQVEWIPAQRLLPVPPMPQPPARPTRSDASSTSPRLAPTLRTPQLIAPSEAAAPRQEPAPSGAALMGQLEGFARSQSDIEFGPGDPLERTQRLPGRAEPFVPGVRLRRKLTAADWVAIVGRGVFGATGGATCADIRRKITSDLSDVERMKLIHDEREICRRGEAGTYRH